MPARVFNFSAGPSALFPEVRSVLGADVAGGALLERASRDAEGPVVPLLHATLRALRRVLGIPDTHSVALCHGGGLAAHAALPLNLCRDAADSAAFLSTGVWSDRALAEAARFCVPHIAAASPTRALLPTAGGWDTDPQRHRFVHFTLNETADGREFHSDAHLADLPAGSVVVADATSTLLSRPVQWGLYDVVYASGGKNLGPVGVTVVVGRTATLQRAAAERRRAVPAVLDWHANAEAGSALNTPCVFALLGLKRTLDFVERKGGVERMQAEALQKSTLVYNTLDDHARVFAVDAPPDCRSRMNACFKLRSPADTRDFLAAAKDAGFVGLQGHAERGGCRATLYNAVPWTAVQRLAAFLRGYAVHSVVA